MSNELIVLEKVELVPFFTKGEKVNDVVAQLQAEARAFVPDVTTAKGRAAIKALVTKVTKSKTYLEGHGKTLAAEYKAIPKVIDANRKLVKDALTELAEEIRKPLTEFEEEATRLAIEKMNAEKAAELAAKVEIDHEFGLLLNAQFDTDRAAKLEAERIEAEQLEAQRKADQEAREKRIAEESAERERLASIEREAEIQRKADESERQRIATEERAKIEAKQAEERRVLAEKQAKLDAAQAAENARVAEVARQEAEAKRIADENAKREANKKHVGAIRKAAKESIMDLGIDEETAKKLVLAIHNNEIANVSIKY
jgi:colicin import membrane protein